MSTWHKRESSTSPATPVENNTANRRPTMNCLAERSNCLLKHTVKCAGYGNCCSIERPPIPNWKRDSRLKSFSYKDAYRFGPWDAPLSPYHAVGDAESSDFWRLH